MNPFSSSKIIASLTSILLYALIIFDVIGDFSYLFQVTSKAEVLLTMKYSKALLLIAVFAI